MGRGGSILKNTFTVGAFTSLSRVLGLVREMMQSRLIGAGVAQSAFTLAFALPNMARKLFGEGALTAAFVSVFRGEVEEVGVAKAARLARAVMTTVFLMLGALVSTALAGLVVARCGADAYGFTERTRLTLSLVMVLMPYMLAICGAAFGMGVLNALGKFTAASLMPALLNVFWIVALAILCIVPCESVVARIHFVAFAILVGGFAQLAFMFLCMRRAGVSPRPTFKGWGDAKVRLVWRNLGIAAFGAGAVQVNYMLDQVLAQLAAPWAAGVVGYAERLMDLPLGVIGVAFGTVLLPTFSGLFAKGDAAGARDSLVKSVNSLMFVMVPAAVGLAVVARETTSVIYEGGEFDAVATMRVARALAVYAAGLGFFGFQKILVPWFQAQKDMKTPLHVSVATVCLNATLNVLAVWLLPVEWRHVGLAASTVLCAAVGCTMLAVLARRRNGPLGLARCIVPLLRTGFASALMAAALCAHKSWIYSTVESGGSARLSPIPALASLVALGCVVYFGAIALLGGKLRRARQEGKSRVKG